MIAPSGDHWFWFCIKMVRYVEAVDYALRASSLASFLCEGMVPQYVALRFVVDRPNKELSRF